MAANCGILVGGFQLAVISYSEKINPETLKNILQKTRFCGFIHWEKFPVKC
jgi:hypothetical protein